MRIEAEELGRVVWVFVKNGEQDLIGLGFQCQGACQLRTQIWREIEFHSVRTQVKEGARSPLSGARRERAFSTKAINDLLSPEAIQDYLTRRNIK